MGEVCLWLWRVGLSSFCTVDLPWTFHTIIQEVHLWVYAAAFEDHYHGLHWNILRYWEHLDLDVVELLPDGLVQWVSGSLLRE